MYICKYLSFLLFIKLALLAYFPVYAQTVDDNPTGDDLTNTGNGGNRVLGGGKVDDNPSGHELTNGSNGRTNFDDNPSGDDLSSGSNSTRSSNSAIVHGISIGAIFAVSLAFQYYV